LPIPFPVQRIKGIGRLRFHRHILLLDVHTKGMYYCVVEFQWNEMKSRENLRKHGLCFEDAAGIFEGETVTFLDDRFEYGEKRYVTLGALDGRVIVTVHTQRGETIRIISMRKANGREKKIYQERLGKN